MARPQKQHRYSDYGMNPVQKTVVREAMTSEIETRRRR